MQAIHSIHTVTGPDLTIDLPPSFQGKQVEVVVTPIEQRDETAEEILARKLRGLIMEKPPVSAELRKRLNANPYLLRQATPPLGDPFGPACPPEDWEVNQ
jgi:hypothetical protein